MGNVRSLDMDFAHFVEHVDDFIESVPEIAVVSYGEILGRHEGVEIIQGVEKKISIHCQIGKNIKKISDAVSGIQPGSAAILYAGKSMKYEIVQLGGELASRGVRVALLPCQCEPLWGSCANFERDYPTTPKGYHDALSDHIVIVGPCYESYGCHGGRNGLKMLIDRILDNGEMWFSTLGKMLRSEPSTGTNEVVEFPTWKTIKIGTQKTRGELKKALTRNGFKVDYAGGRLDIALAAAETEVELVLVSARDLGFMEPVRREKIYDRATKAKELGLRLAPAEVGPQLRLQYTDQPLNERMVVAIKPIKGNENEGVAFIVERDDAGPMLSCDIWDCNDMWNPDSLWVFSRRKRN